MTEWGAGFGKRGRRFAWLIVLLLAGAPALKAELSEPAPQNQFGRTLELNQAIQRALASEPEVNRALAKLKKEEALYKGSVSEFFPKLGAEAFEALATGEKTWVSFIEAGVEQPLFMGGKILAGKRKHEARLQMEELKLREIKLELELRVRILYAELLKERQLVLIAQDEVKELSREHERAKALLDQELTPRHEFFRLEALFERAKYALIKHKETYDYLLNVLRETVGIKENESLTLEVFSDFPELEGDISFYLELSRKENPLYRLGDLKVKEKTHEKRELQAERFPHVSLKAKWIDFRDIFVETDRFMAGVQGTWAVWDFGRIGSEIKAKSHEIEESKWTRAIEIQEHEREIRKLFHEARAAREKIRFTEAYLREREELFKNEKTRLVTGEKASMELLDSFLALHEARTQRLQALTEYKVLLARLGRRTAFREVLNQENGEGGLKNPELDEREGGLWKE